MKRLVVPDVEPAPGADRSLGRLGPPLERLAGMQGAWPARVPRTTARLVVDGGSLEAGTAQADALADGGTDLLVLAGAGDPVPGLVACAALLDLEPVHAVGTAAGPGWAAAMTSVRDGLRACRPHLSDPARLLQALGSPVLAHLTGLLAQSAVRRTPVLLDGSVLVAGAALVADRLAPGAAAWWLAGQAPPAPAAAKALADLDLAPLLDLGLDRPEGADLALGLLTAGVELARG